MPGNLSDNARAMSHDEFTKLFKYVEELRLEMLARFDRVDAEFLRIYSLFDKVNKDLEVGEQERLFMNRQLERHDRWIHTVAEATHTDLP